MSTCIFCQIASGDLPAQLAFENDELLVIHDLHPQAPTHLLVIPKRHLATINACESGDDGLLGRMILAAQQQVAQLGLSEAGYRLVFNVNSGGGQDIYHIHLHVLAGRQMTWPPG
jgi:histidine triad (HIT) family protein